MLASVSEAEDVVQDAFLRFERALADGTEIESPKAYLSAVVTRLAIDQLRSARSRRETYVGEWLPEPLLTNGDDDPAAHAEEADSLSMAFLLLPERLSPVERAVFLLHDVFGYGYDEVATIVDKSETNCRQLAHRARNHIESEKPRFEASRKKRDELAARFFAAVGDGDLDGLVERVARLLAGIGGQLGEHGITIRPRLVNGQPGAIFLDPEGRLTNVWSLDIVDGAVQTVRSVINPDKLGHLGPVADVRALLRKQR
jgi:RNA polymerase sigma-70 factor (ECF subfamily)